MFGKKKAKDGDDATAEAVAEATSKGGKAPKKAKKSKKNVTSRGPGFMAQHFEKFLMVLVLAGVGFFFYSGFSGEGYSKSRSPKDLKDQSSSALTQIKQDHWDVIKEEEQRQVEVAFVENASKAREPIATTVWETNPPYVWGEPPSQSFEKRGDPVILPPEQLVVENVNGALAVMVATEMPDHYDEFPDAEKIEKRVRGRRGRRQNQQGGDDYGAGMGGGGYGDDYAGGGDGYGAGFGGGGTAGRRLNGSYDLGASVGGGGGGMGGMGGYGDGGLGGGLGGGMGPGMGGDDYGAGMGGGYGGGAGGTGNRQLGEKEDGPKFKPSSKAVVFNAITAVIPHKQIFESYRENLENTGQFVASRDVPVYLSFELQRVDVTDDPGREIKEEEWKDLPSGIQQYRLPETAKWAGGRVQEVVERNSVERGLTMPIPPMLVRDYRTFARHPAIDWSWNFKALVAPRTNNMDEDEDEDESATQLPGATQQRRSGMGMGMGGDDYGAGMGGDDYGAGMGAGMGGGYGDDYAGGMGAGMGGGYGDDYAGGMGAGMGDGYGDDYGAGMGGGSAASSYEAPQPDFKMIRCYDFSLGLNDIGKVYRYRVRVLMRDPNYPEDATIPEVPPSSMKDDVWQRVAAVKQSDEAKRKKAGDDKILSQLLESEWSAPSDAVMVAAPYEVFAGEIDFSGPQTFKLQDKVYSISTKEAEATVVVTTLDSRTGAKIAKEHAVRRGSVLNAQKSEKLDFIVPMSRAVKVFENPPTGLVNTFATIVDMRGGNPLDGYSRDDPQRAIGEMLILHRDGRVEVTEDYEDLFLYRMYSFADEKEAAEKAAAPADDGGGMGDMGGYSG